MKIATFLLTDKAVVPLANNAKFIELTEAHDEAYEVYAATNKETRDFEDALEALAALNDELSEEHKAVFAIQVELCRFLALATLAERKQHQSLEGQCVTKSKEFLPHPVDLTERRAGNDTKTYDYDTIDSRFSTITNYDHKFELRFISKYFKDAFDAYETIGIFELSEHDTTYDVRGAIDNRRNLYDGLC